MENLQALHNFDSIAAAADAIVLSRGNLGLDVAPEKTAVVQKAAINRCNLLGKPVIITRVVDTMVEAPRCTRCLPLLHPGQILTFSFGLRSLDVGYFFPMPGDSGMKTMVAMRTAERDVGGCTPKIDIMFLLEQCCIVCSLVLGIRSSCQLT